MYVCAYIDCTTLSNLKKKVAESPLIRNVCTRSVRLIKAGGPVNQFITQTQNGNCNISDSNKPDYKHHRLRITM